MGSAGGGRNLVAFLVVGLGMLLIAGLGGFVLWTVSRRRAAAQAPQIEPDTVTGTEPAEA